MDKPYVLYEDVADAVGNSRKFQTTKLKFYDPFGRLCLLGMSLDITEMERVKKESEQAQAAYQRALSTSAVYESIINALAEDYFDLYYVDTETDDYIEYGSRTETGHRMTELHGADFFASTRRNVPEFIFEEDQPGFLRAIDKENLLGEIRKHGFYVYYYRLMVDDAPTYVSMKATSISGDDRHIIIGINNVDSQLRDRRAVEQAKETRRAYGRLNALNNNLIVLYIVDAETDQYTEFSATRDYEELGIEKQGEDFFGTTFKNSLRTVHPEDQAMFHSLVTRDGVLKSIEQDEVFVFDYRLMVDELPTYVRLKAAKVEEDGKTLLIVGLLDVDAQVRQEQEHAHDLSLARKQATRDALTGVKNKFAYVDAENRLNAEMEAGLAGAFAVVVCDINDLKFVNDTLGHRAGDQYIRNASATICHVFKRSPVFRVGGDEFAVICCGYDYEHIGELMESMRKANEESRQYGGVQIACGMAKCEDDTCLASVFERADRNMYGHKSDMKAGLDDTAEP